MANAPAKIDGVDPRLIDVIEQAGAESPYEVKIISGFRSGDKRFHGKGAALDVALYDPATGKMVPNYQDANSFRIYEEFAQKVRTIQEEQHPDLSSKLRWGGYFSGAPGKYGAVDLMHFDLGAKPGLGMAGGSWETGLTPEQSKLFPGAQSIGMANLGDKPANSVGKPSTYDNVQKQIAANLPPNQLTALIKAYQNGDMSPEEKASFEADAKAGRIMLPQGVTVGKSVFTGQARELPQSVIDAYNNAAANPYNQNVMTVDERKQLDADIANGIVKVPNGVKLNQTYPGVMASVGEAITGNQRATDATRNLPELADSGVGLFNGLEIPAAKKAAIAQALVTTTDPKEIAQILRSADPSIGIAEDEKGNLIAANNKTGVQAIINKPGFSQMDLLQGLGLGAAFTPAGKASSVLGMAGKSLATQAAIEGGQVAAGGNFDTGEVVTAGVLGGAVPAAVQAVQAVKAPAAQIAARALGREAPSAAPAARTIEEAAQVAPALLAPSPAPMPGAARPALSIPPALEADAAALGKAQAAPGAVPPPKPGPAAAAPNAVPPPVPEAPLVAPAVQPKTVLTPSELTQTSVKAAEGGFGAGKAKTTLAEQAAQDAETLAAAERLGISEHLQPDHTTTNQAFRELAQAVKSVPGSQTSAQELQGLQAVASKADSLITSIGGTHDISTLNHDVKSALMATQKKLEADADKIYEELRAQIPARHPVTAPNVLEFIKTRIADLGDVANISPTEKMIRGKLTPKPIGDTGELKQPTYALLDDVRRDLTAARIANKGPFKDTDSGLIKKLEMELRKDQGAAIEPFGLTEKFAVAQKTVAVRKGLEDDLKSLFGKQIDGSIQTALDSSFKAASKGDGTKLEKLIATIPPELRQNVVASGLASAFGKHAQYGNMNFNTFAKWYEGLQTNRLAYNAVMANLPPEARRNIQDLYKVAKSVSMATRERITTGRIQAITNEFQGADGLLGSIVSAARKSGAAWAAEAVTTSIGLPGVGITAGLASALTKGKTPAIKAADALLASPEFNEAVKLIAKGKSEEAATKLAGSSLFTKFARQTGIAKDINGRKKWIDNATKQKD